MNTYPTLCSVGLSSDGGSLSSEKRLSSTRLPRTGVSTVTQMAFIPSETAFLIDASDLARSGLYRMPVSRAMSEMMDEASGTHVQ